MLLLGGGAPHPSGTGGSLAHRRGTRDVWGMERSTDSFQITKATSYHVPTCGKYSDYVRLLKTGTGMKVFVTAKHAVPVSTPQRQDTYIRPYCVLPVAQAGKRAGG